MKIDLYPPDLQGTGGFDGGRITEQKPIGFPGESSAVKRVGPLFYWSWFHAEEAGFIPAHPHQAFEIVTYVIHGHAEHGDSLGTKSRVSAGGAQVMQTGSGVYHEERFIGPDMEGFQIWFEPYIRDAIKRPPAYFQYGHEDFPVTESDGVRVKTVIGEGSPVCLVCDTRMWDVEVSPGSHYCHTLPQDRTIAALAIRGSGKWTTEGDKNIAVDFQNRDFMVIRNEDDSTVLLSANEQKVLRMILIEVPAEVDYPLYVK